MDSKPTAIERVIRLTPVCCRKGENVEACERLMQEHQVRGIPIVDAEDCVIGMVAQADLALKDKPERVSETVAEISRAKQPSARSSPRWQVDIGPR